MQIRLNELRKLLANKDLRGKSIVLVGGTFDILHSSHIDFLEQSKSFGDILIVVLASDKEVRKRKGNDRPIQNQRERAKVISTLKPVDFVFISDLSAYSDKIISMLNPSTIVFSLDGGKALYRRKYKRKIEKSFPKVRVEIIDTPRLSTSVIINKILKLNK
ncbi:MAG: adenylyltransferase/cytidyltransferase family protein [Patescibacteria group bacterium]